MATPRLARVQLVGADGGPLRVDIRSGAKAGQWRPAVVICHGFKGFKDWGFFPRLAERLALAGFTAVSFNFSGSGVGGDGEIFDELERWGHQTLTGDSVDLGAVVDYVCGQGAPWLAVVGHSRGGGLAVLQAAKDARVQALVTWAAVSRFGRWSEEEVARWRERGSIDVVNTRTGQVLTIFRDAILDLDANLGGTLNILAAAARVRIPWLIMHGAADETVPVEEAERLSRASVSERTELVRIEGAGHTFGAQHPWAGSTPELDRVMDRTIRFLAAQLP